MADAEDVQRIALSLPEAAQSGSGFHIREKGFAWFYQEKIAGVKGRVERRDVLAVRVADAGEKEALLASDPEKFFTTPHYNGYPAVLVRLPAIDNEELTDLLSDAWRNRAPRKMVTAFDTLPRKESNMADSGEATTGEISFPTPENKTGTGYLASGTGDSTGPGVLVLHAWWGLNDFTRGFCDRLAGDGFVALAVDIYGGGQIATTIEEATVLRDAHDADGRAAYDRIAGGLEFLRKHPAVIGDRVAVIGFSLGAWWALSLEAHIGQVVVFYGLGDPDTYTADAPVLGHFAEQDEWEPVEGVRAFVTALSARGKSMQAHVYPGTGHWFFESDRPEYNATAAETAYQRTVAFLRG